MMMMMEKLVFILNAIKVICSLLYHIIFYARRRWSYADFFEEQVDSSPNTVQMVMAENGKSRTRKEMELLSNQVANWAVSMRYSQKETVALMLYNSLDYPCVWLGLAKVGVSTALLNTNVFGNAFIHSCEVALKDSLSKILIIDEELAEKLKDEIKQLINEKNIEVVFWGESEVSFNNTIITAQPTTRPKKIYRDKIISTDPVVYIFTSGTTGLPKACKMASSKFLYASLFLPLTGGLNANDTIYVPLPLYHSAAGLLAVGACLYSGAVLISRKKFSASNFSSDLIKYKATCFQYIGELCRFLVSIPDNELDQQVQLRMIFGNGLRGDVWPKFCERYHVKNVVEFYGATEANIVLCNFFNKVGAIGYFPRFMDKLLPCTIVKADPEDSSIPLRDEKTGFCIRCKDNEVGLFISKIGAIRFDGYTDKKASEKKVLTNVFKTNDQFFNSGDLLSRDADGYYYWSDRVGDTFRWKGENVSTTEVNTVLLSCQEAVEDVVVYGVTVPGADGRAGMATIIPTEQPINLSALTAKINKELADYAKPQFLRVKKPNEKLPVTSTHKQVKSSFVAEGFDPAKVGDDELFYYDVKSKQYKPLDEQYYKL